MATIREHKAREDAGEPVISPEQAVAELEWSDHLNELLKGMPEGLTPEQRMELLEVMGLGPYPSIDNVIDIGDLE